jgi:hypothetical protein
MVKSLKKCGIINALGGAEYDVLLEESGSSNSNIGNSGFGGLGVSVLAFGTQVRGFKPSRSCRIFQGEKKSSARLPSEGK